MDEDLKSLHELLADLNELISITPEDQVQSLIEHKIQIEEIIALKQTELDNKSNDTGANQQDIFAHLPDNEVPGNRCSIVGWTSRGYYGKQNAIISEVLRIGTERRMRIFFTNPTKISDIPCNSYLSHKDCTRERCRFSHGTIVSAEDLCEWYEPEPELYLNENQLCLALPENANIPIWNHGFIRHTDVESGTCVVEWITVSPDESILKSAVNLPFTHVHPFPSQNTENSDVPHIYGPILPESFEYIEDQSSDCSNDDGEEENAQVETNHKIIFSLKEVLQPGLTQSSEVPSPSDSGSGNQNDPLGAWELHTRGIGSRLLQKMGYTGEGGLGKSGRGRRNPVATDPSLHQICDEFHRYRPTIDRLVQLKIQKMTKKKATSSRKRASTAAASTKREKQKIHKSGSVFDFLNQQILADSIPEPTKPQITQASVKNMTQMERNTAILRIGSEIDLVKKEITRAEESISRNEKSNTVVANMARQKLSDLHKRLHRLHDQESKLTSHREKQNSVDKKRIF